MTKRQYSLVLPVRLGPEYGGGWAAGSVTAHWFHLKKGNPGVFWVWPMSPSGIRREDKHHLKKLIERLGRPIGENGEVSVSRRGFFYEANRHSITWQFEADYVLPKSMDNRERRERLSSKDLSSCIPLFRREYLKPQPRGD